MSGRIPREFIDELLARADIVELIDARVPLTKAGRDFKACCPFHNEKTPSFTVSQTKQFYHCFGCGANGSAIGFLMEFEHLSFREAIEELIKEKLANKWMGPSTILGVGPCKVGQKVVGSRLLYLDMPHDNQTDPRVSVLRCKRCFQPYDNHMKRETNLASCLGKYVRTF